MDKTFWNAVIFLVMLAMAAIAVKAYSKIFS